MICGENVPGASATTLIGRRPRSLGESNPALALLMIATSIAACLGISGIACAQPPIEAAQVSPETTDFTLAETVASAWTAIHGGAHVVRRVEDTYLVASMTTFEHERIYFGTPVPVSDVHSAVRALFAHGEQAVTELEPQRDESGTYITVAVDAARAFLVVTGPGAHDIPHVVRPRYGLAPRPDPAGCAVRDLGPRWRDAPMRIAVAPDARISLLTQPFTLRLDYEYSEFERRGTISFDHVRARHRLELTLDGEPLAFEQNESQPGSSRAVLERELERGQPGSSRVVLERELERGEHLVVARLVRRSNEELIAEQRLVFRYPVFYSVHLFAGGSRECVRLDADSVAASEHVGSLSTWSGLRVEAEPAAARHGLYRAGTRICITAPLWAADGETTSVLYDGTRHEPAALRIDVDALPSALRLGVPGSLFALSFILLLFAWLPRRTDPATHIAWTRTGTESYRGTEAPRWRLAALPSAETPLGDLDDSLAGFAHTISARGANACFTAQERPVIVAPPGLAVTLQIADATVPAGTQVLDGELRIAIVGSGMAARIAAGHAPEPPSSADVERARVVGFVGELVAIETPALALRTLGAFAAACLATAFPHLPAALDAGFLRGLAPWLATSWMWLAASALSILTVALVARLARTRTFR